MEMPDRTDQEMSTSAMLLLGGGSTLVMAAVLGLSLLFGIGGKATGVAQSQPVVATVVSSSGGADPSAPATPGAGQSAARIVVPALVGVDSMTATSQLASLRLSVAAMIRVPSALARGQVVRTYPAAGASVPAGCHVTLYISGTATGTRVAMPYLIGVSAEQARSTAAQFGLRLVI